MKRNTNREDKFSISYSSIKRSKSLSPTRMADKRRSWSPRQENSVSRTPRGESRTRRSQRRERCTRSKSPGRERTSRSKSPGRERTLRSKSPGRERTSKSRYPQSEKRSRPKAPYCIQPRQEQLVPQSSDSDCEVIYEYKHVEREDTYYKKFGVNQEVNDGVNRVLGSYYCQICEASMSGELPYYTHIQGKRHEKALKARNPSAIVEESLLNYPLKSNYPPVSANKFRVCLNQIAKVQHLVEQSLKVPSPGLHNLFEIQNTDDTETYYCALCDSAFQAICLISHLEGYKHLLNCLKLYDDKTYKKHILSKKEEIGSSVIRILKDIQKENGGMGYITVEKDYMNESLTSLQNKMSRRRKRVQRYGSSSRSPEHFTATKYKMSIQPDTSKSDYYCKLCDSHMNSKHMWEAHITGTRHLKNLKKGPGERPSKVKSYPIKDVRAKIMDEIDKLREPVIGLDVIRETQNPTNDAVQYNCFLCGGCMTELDIVDHILSVKHKTKYLKKIRRRDYLMVKNMRKEQRHFNSVIEEAVAKVFDEQGPGEVEVHVTKNAVAKW